MVCKARDKKSGVSIDIVFKVDGFTDEQLEDLWIKFFDDIVNKMVEIRQRRDNE